MGIVHKRLLFFFYITSLCDETHGNSTQALIILFFTSTPYATKHMGIVHKHLFFFTFFLSFLHQLLVYLLLLLLPIYLLTPDEGLLSKALVFHCSLLSVRSFRALINSLVRCLSTQREGGMGRRNRTYTEWEAGWVSAITKHKICHSCSFYSKLYCIYSGRIKYLKRKEFQEEVEKRRRKKEEEKTHPTQTHTHKIKLPPNFHLQTKPEVDPLQNAARPHSFKRSEGGYQCYVYSTRQWQKNN